MKLKIHRRSLFLCHELVMKNVSWLLLWHQLDGEHHQILLKWLIKCRLCNSIKNILWISSEVVFTFPVLRTSAAIATNMYMLLAYEKEGGEREINLQMFTLWRETFQWNCGFERTNRSVCARQCTRVRTSPVNHNREGKVRNYGNCVSCSPSPILIFLVKRYEVPAARPHTNTRETWFPGIISLAGIFTEESTL